MITIMNEEQEDEYNPLEDLNSMKNDFQETEHSQLPDEFQIPLEREKVVSVKKPI